MKLFVVYLVTHTLTWNYGWAELILESMGDLAYDSASTAKKDREGYLRSGTDIFRVNSDDTVGKQINSIFLEKSSKSSSNELNSKGNVGCFSDFRSLRTISHSSSTHNSNEECALQCALEGYSLSATQGQDCFCGNSMPDRSVSKLNDSKCNKFCNVHQQNIGCKGAVYCCGGINAYSVRVVGNANVGKAILNRIATRVIADVAIQEVMSEGILSPFPSVPFFERGVDFHDRIREGSTNPYKIFGDKMTFLKFPEAMTTAVACTGENYFTTYPSSSLKKCTKISGFRWGTCYSWGDDCTKVDNRFFINRQRRCCTIIPIIPDIEIVINARLPTSNGNQLRQYSMRADDLTPKSDSFKWKVIRSGNMEVKMVGSSLDLEDLTDIDVSPPEKIENFKPIRCTSSELEQTCTKTFTEGYTEVSTLTIGSGFDLSTTVGSEISTTVGGDIPFGPSVEATISLRAELTASASMSTENSKSKEKSITDSTSVTVKLAPGEEAFIDMKRRTQDIVYGWTCTFELEGRFELTNSRNKHIFALSSVLGDRKFYTYGEWTYPDSDIIEVLVTTPKGTKSCGEHVAGMGGGQCVL